MKRKLATSSPSTSRPPPKKRERGDVPLLAEPELPPPEGEQKPGSESDIQLLRYQNKQLANALQERKEEIAQLNSKVRSLTAKQSLYDNSLGFVARNWDSLHDNLHGILARLEPGSVTFEELVKEETSVHASQESRTFLQLLLKDREKDKEKADGEEEEEEVDETEIEARKLRLKQKIDTTLEERAQTTADVLLKVVAIIQREKCRNDEVSSMLKDKAEALHVQEALANENKILKHKLTSLEQTLDWLQYSNTKLKNQNAQCKDGWIQAEKRMRDMIVELEDAKMDVSSLRSRCKRLHDQVQDTKQNLAKVSLAQATGASAIKQEKTETGADTSNVVKNEEEMAELQLRDEERLKEIKELRAERTELVKEINSLKLQLSNPPDTVVFKSPQYQLLYQQSRLALMDLESLRTQHVQLQHSYDKLEEHWKEEKESLLKSESNRRKALEDEIREKMGLITRLRGEREELQYRLDQKKAAPPATRVAQDFKVILSSTQTQNKKLEKEVKRLKVELAQAQELGGKGKESREEALSNQISNVNGGNPATSVATRQATEDQHDLQEKVKTLQRTIEEFQRRERKMEEEKREMKVMLDVYQSESKEKRDVTEIRRAERRVIEDNKRLQTKLARYERDPRQGQPSGPPRPEGEKHRHEKPPQPSEKRGEQQPSEKAIQDLKKALENEKREGEMLLQEMSAISKSFEELQEQNSRLLQQLSEKEDASTKLLSERIKSEQVQNLLREETKTLQQQLKLAAEKYEQQADTLKKEGEKLKAVEQHLDKSNEQFRQMGNLLELHKRTAREAAEQAADLRNRLEHASNVIAELKKNNDELISSLHKEEEKVARLVEERTTLRRRLDKYTSQGSADALLEEELIATKKLLICPVCNDRRKDTVITRCFHVFCAPCIKKNLAIRHRKCPGCSKPFGEKDVQRIYLGSELEGDGGDGEGKE